MPFNSMEGLNGIEQYMMFSTFFSVETEMLVLFCSPDVSGLSLFLYCPQLELGS